MKRNKKIDLFLFLLLLAILPYCYLSFFTNPSADDFGFAVQSQKYDLLLLIKQTYLYWNGRYVSNVFIYLNPIAQESYFGYKLVSFALILLLGLANFLFIRQLLSKNKKQNQLIISFILSLLFMHNMPIISEGLYWFTGTVIYLLGIITALFYFTFLIKTVRENKKGGYPFFLLLLLFLTCGFNEVLTLLMVFILLVVSAIFYKKKLKGKKVIFTQFICAVLFAALVVFSPGNEYREVAYQNAHNFSHSFLYSLMQVGRFSLLWIGSIPLVAASFLYFQFNRKMRQENELFKNSFYLTRWTSLLILFALIFICVFPAYWATGILGQHRTLNVAYFFFLIMWFINLSVWYNYYQEKLRFALNDKIMTTLSMFFIVGLVFTNNGYNAISDIFSGSANSYNEQLLNRFTTLKEARQLNKSTITITKLMAQPKSLFVSEITNNPKDWTTQGYMLYFKIEDKKLVIQETAQDQ